MGKKSRRAGREARKNAPVPEPKRVPKAVWIIIAVIVLGAGGAWIWLQQGGEETPEFVNPLVMLSDELNATCPRLMDENTRLDSTGAGPLRFAYYYSLLNASVGQFLPGEFEGMMRPQIVAQLKSKPENEIMRKLKVTLEYHYADNGGRLLGVIVLRPGQY